MQRREGDIAAALLQRCGGVKRVWARRCSTDRWGGMGAVRRRAGGMGAAWWGREGDFSARCCGVPGVGTAWERRKCGVGAVRGWHGRDARAAPEVKVEECTS